MDETQDDWKNNQNIWSTFIKVGVTSNYKLILKKTWISTKITKCVKKLWLNSFEILSSLQTFIESKPFEWFVDQIKIGKVMQDFWLCLMDIYCYYSRTNAFKLDFLEHKAAHTQLNFNSKSALYSHIVVQIIIKQNFFITTCTVHQNIGKSISYSFWELQKVPISPSYH